MSLLYRSLIKIRFILDMNIMSLYHYVFHHYNGTLCHDQLRLGMLRKIAKITEVTPHFTKTARVPKFQSGNMTCPRSRHTEARLKLMALDQSNLFSTVLAASV